MLKSMFVSRSKTLGACALRLEESVLTVALAVALSCLGGCGADSSPGGSSGAGGSGGSGMPVMVNGCDSTMAIDKTDDASTMIAFAGIEYTPRCVRIRTGSEIVFSGTFASHPLVGGTVNGSTTTPDPSSAIPATNSGSEITFALPKAGAYPYYCSAHASSGMMGAIFAESK